MNNKKIAISTVVTVIVFGGVIVYGYNQAQKNTTPKPIQSIFNEVVKVQKQKIGPSIKIESPSFDFGTVIFGDVPEHKFIVKNVGSKDLKILRLSTSCGCTKAFMSEKDKVIAPGKSVEMKVTFNPAVHKDSTDLGALTRTIYVKSNDASNQEVEAIIKAYVVKSSKK